MGKVNLHSHTTDIDFFFKTLRHAARYIVAELDLEILYNHALEILADFSHSNFLSILLLNDDNTSVRVVAKLVDGKYDLPNTDIPLPDFLKEAIISRKPIIKEVHPEQQCYFLNIKVPQQINRITCLPLIGTQEKLLGFITFLSSSTFKLEKFQEESLTILTTLIATTIENANLFHLATYDGLTGLYARRYFDIRLQEEITRLNRTPGDLSLIIMDIDLFKKVNDTYGHLVGDGILRELGKIIWNSIRKNLDLPCRYGGEEFAIILPATAMNGAVRLAERIRTRCENHTFEIGDYKINITLSAGISSTNHQNLVKKEELIRVADENLYLAKRSGRNCIRY